MKENSLNTDSKSPTVLSFREVRQIYGDFERVPPEGYVTGVHVFGRVPNA